MWTVFDGRLTAFSFCPTSPSFFFYCQKISRLLLSQCMELAASGWRLWWDLGTNCYSRLRMEMRITGDWQNRLLRGLSYYTVSRSSSGEGKTPCGTHAEYALTSHYGFGKIALMGPLLLAKGRFGTKQYVVSFEDAFTQNYKHSLTFIRSLLGNIELILLWNGRLYCWKEVKKTL